MWAIDLVGRQRELERCTVRVERREAVQGSAPWRYLSGLCVSCGVMPGIGFDEQTVFKTGGGSGSSLYGPPP